MGPIAKAVTQAVDEWPHVDWMWYDKVRGPIRSGVVRNRNRTRDTDDYYRFESLTSMAKRKGKSVAKLFADHVG